jgi:hypothetical protein
MVKRAAGDGTLIPLDGLAGAFPTTQDRFTLAYAESVSAVDRIVRVNGRDALVSLIRSYHEGVSDDAAFEAALGRDAAGFEADWLAELGAKPPTRVGPRPAPAGPLPAGWGAPQPDPSFEVVGSQPPVPNAPSPTPRGPDDTIAFLVAPLATLGLVVAAVAVALGFRRVRSRPDPARWAETGDNRLFGRPPSVEVPDDPRDPASPGSRLWSTPDWSLPRDLDEPAVVDQQPEPTPTEPDVASPPPPDEPDDRPLLGDRLTPS